ncbi:MAG: anti-sigma factor [Proteobacteria bacterium]|nr:anti-sigma factor [Pseudomonadota bacterium]
MLHAWLDGELDAANAATVEAHIEKCPDCSGTAERMSALRETIAGPALRYAPPTGLRERIDHDLPDRQRPARQWPQRAGWAAGGAIAASLALVLATPRPSETANVGPQLVASHVRSLLADHLVDIRTSDRHVVKPWFNGKIDFSPPTPDLAADGFPLVGGRLDYVGGRVVPAIVYRRRLHTINLFVWPANGAAPATMSVDGYTVLHWRQGDLDYWAVSDVAADDLAQFRAAFERAR